MRKEIRVYDDILTATKFNTIRIKLKRDKDRYTAEPFKEYIEPLDDLLIVKNELEDNEVLFGRFSSEEDCKIFLDRIRNSKDILKNLYDTHSQKGVSIETYKSIKEAFINRFFYVIKTKKGRFKLTQSRFVVYDGNTVTMEEPLVSGEIVKKSRDRSDCVKYIKSVS